MVAGEVKGVAIRPEAQWPEITPGAKMLGCALPMTGGGVAHATPNTPMSATKRAGNDRTRLAIFMLPRTRPRKIAACTIHAMQGIGGSPPLSDERES